MSDYHDNWKPGDELERLSEALAASKEREAGLRAELADTIKTIGVLEGQTLKFRARIEELERGLGLSFWLGYDDGFDIAVADQPYDPDKAAERYGYKPWEDPVITGHIITDAEIDNAIKHINTSQLEWVRAFAYGVLFELGLLDDEGEVLPHRPEDDGSGPLSIDIPPLSSEQAPSISIGYKQEE